MRIKSNLLLAAMAATGALSAASCASQPQETKEPNLLFIFPDQYRLQALGIWQNPEYRELLSTVGDPVSTPNIDKLTQSGVLFTDVCSIFPLSSPHRGMLMSGIYSAHNGLDGNAHVNRTLGLNHDITSFTNVLQSAGYETAYIGKTHWERTERLFDKDNNYVGTTEDPGGHSMNPYDTYIPEGKGRFGNEFWFQQIRDSHFNAICYSNNPQFVDGKKDGDAYYPKRFTTSVEADVLIDYLENKDGKLRDESKPFSMIWSINPPHNPYSTLNDCEPEVYNRLFADKSLQELLVRDNVVFKDEKDKARLKLTAGVYFSLISSIDREIGRVLDKLEEIGEADNTMIVFTADHGEMMGSHGLMGKPQIYDEAYRVPFIISYPGVLKQKTEDLRLSTIDIMPTLLGLMGLGDMIPEAVNGRDYSAGLISGDYSKNAKPQSSFYRAWEASRGVRCEKYVYWVKETGDYELYDNINDPYQMKSLSLDKIPAKDAKFLKDQLAFWLKDSRDSWYKVKKCSELINY